MLRIVEEEEKFCFHSFPNFCNIEAIIAMKSLQCLFLVDKKFSEKKTLILCVIKALQPFSVFNRNLFSLQIESANSLEEKALP